MVSSCVNGTVNHSIPLRFIWLEIDYVFALVSGFPESSPLSHTFKEG